MPKDTDKPPIRCVCDTLEEAKKCQSKCEIKVRKKYSKKHKNPNIQSWPQIKK